MTRWRQGCGTWPGSGVRHGVAAAGADAVACPYKGLARYEPSDAPLFHGREELVARLCARLVDTTFVAVVGPSGAGKSSLVRAGLLPALAAGVLPGLADAQQHLLVPGGPLPVLDGSAVVVVDQFEEVFAAITDDVARQRYLDDLTALAARPDTRIVVVLRGDFVGACAAHAGLARLLGDGTVLVGPMRPEEIRRAVEQPARQVGLHAEPALVDAIVSDMQDAPGALPLMSTALVEVWQGRSGGTLTAAAYHRAGGVPGALARLGEAALARLDEPAKAAARRILLRLAETGEGGVLVRRRVPRRELGDDPATARALHELVNRRLLTAGDTGVEVTHEALLTHWPRLAGWLAEDEQGRALRRHLAPAAAEWDVAGRPDTELYRGARLASALDWAGDRLAELTDVERDFLAASRDYADRQLAEETARADRQARARRRLRRRARRRGQPASGRRRRHLDRGEPPAGRVHRRPPGPGAPAGRPGAGAPPTWTGPCCWRCRRCAPTTTGRPAATCSRCWAAAHRRCGRYAASATRRNHRTHRAHPGRLDAGGHARQRRRRVSTWDAATLTPTGAADADRPARRGDHPRTRPVRRLHLGGHRLQHRLPGADLLGRPRQADPGHVSAASGHHRLDPADRPVHRSASAGRADTGPAAAALRPDHGSAARPACRCPAPRATSGRSGRC